MELPSKYPAHTATSILTARGEMHYPEIESGLISANHLRHENQKTLSTSIDLLEIPRDPLAKAIWREGLDHDALLKNVEVIISNRAFIPSSTVILIHRGDSPTNLRRESILAPRSRFCKYTVTSWVDRYC